MVTISPNDVSDEMFAGARRHLSEREVVEVVAQAAFENFRARISRTFRIEADGFATMPPERLPKVF
jgi:alkylhydroperoxidase family enzyme